MANKVTQERINYLMKNAHWDVQTVYGKCTVVSCQLENGFVLTESSACVDPENYDPEIGVEICRKRIEDRLWYLEGYLMQVQEYENRLRIRELRKQTP